MSLTKAPFAAIVLVCAGLIGTSQAQTAARSDFPNRSVKIVVGSSPGGGIDNISRQMAMRMSQITGQTFVIENRPGAGTTIGAGVVAKSPGDGYTIYTAATSFAVAPGLFKSLPYDTVKDFTPVTLLAYSPLLLTVNPNLPVRSTQELIALAKAKPGQLKFGSAGQGTSVHLAGELLKLAGGLDLLHVPYKGSAPATTDLIAGQIDFIFGGLIEMLPHVRAGRLRALAVTGRARSASLADIPTVGEAGITFEIGSWYGFLVPSSTPHDIVLRLHEISARALADPTLRDTLAKQATDVIADGPDKFGPYLKAEVEKWGRLVKQAGLKAAD